ncbi:MAG: tRNA pseudouridine(55) synthase TruB [Proteobacteria bacterium]|nr:tRNA pseudouridine(55) synthase TruB [Pseudomonadota bacterium]MDA1323245.1 tRNA pseudouridine(55) synthase TruB [Pseudomonadota bacterium]
MGRRKKGQPIHGWLIIDKPAGKTSSQVVSNVKRILDAQKAGHGGTLDPLATGILPIALGEATKTVSYVMDGAKRYRFAIAWGEARDTDDSEGVVTQTSAVRPSEADIRAVLPDFTGVIDQVPPDYSAIKINGNRAYALARAGETVIISSRQVRIDGIELIDLPDEDHAVFEVACGKGTYMRSLARDIALALGAFGHISSLRRLAVGPFDETDAISLESLESLVHSAPPSTYLRAVESALDDIPALLLNASQADHLRHGRSVRVEGPEGRPFLDTSCLDEGGVLRAMADGRLVALARLVQGEIRPVRVLNV